MVRVGEMTGRLDEVFLRLFAAPGVREGHPRPAVKPALRYPIIRAGRDRWPPSSSSTCS
ncbi:MAG: hypothetical protein MZV65_20380 [Chromatiales bacterium]|nr:hypothetical protein [Chromatiales bacterium]